MTLRRHDHEPLDENIEATRDEIEHAQAGIDVARLSRQMTPRQNCIAYLASIGYDREEIARILEQKGVCSRATVFRELAEIRKRHRELAAVRQLLDEP